MKLNEKEAGAVTLSLTQTFSIFTSLMPPFNEVRKAAGDDATVNDVRTAAATGAALCIGLGLVEGAIIDSPTPLIASVISAAVLIGIYEFHLRQPPKEVVK